jgi:vacuolar-type H+-ATPase subunit I/STV1
MKIMKRIFYGLIVALLLFAGIGVLSSRMSPPCSAPLTYSIGSFDSRFGVTQADFIKEVQAAESVWENAAGRDLFKYDPNSSFKVNLIYDDRQAQTDAYKQIEDTLQSSENQFNSLDEEYKSLAAEYQQKHDAYTVSSSKLESDLAAYNKEVDSWNKKGGAPESEYQKLDAEKADLDARSQALESDRQALNALGSKVNLLADEGSGVAANYNNTVSTYNEKFGTSTEFDQGDYRGNVINIYQFKGMNDLELVLAHELGHALGMNHVQNSKSIMYYLLQDQNLNDIKPTAEDMAELDSVCKLPVNSATSTAAIN